jgi:hypothetical protein
MRSPDVRNVTSKFGSNASALLIGTIRTMRFLDTANHETSVSVVAGPLVPNVTLTAATKLY